MDVRDIIPETDDCNETAKDLANSIIDELRISESACQIMLSEKAKEFGAIDTSTKTFRQFKDSQSHGDGVKLDLSTKPDLVFTFCPGAHEIRKGGSSERLDENDYEVLTQALLRVYTVRICHAYYNTAWATACTNASAWFVLFERDIDMFDGNIKNAHYERITVRRINHDMIYKIWTAYRNKTTKSPDWFYTHHAPYLLRSISCICDPHMTITRLVAKSMAYVYAMSFPKRDGREFFACPQPDIAVKVFENKEDYSHEKAALEKIVPAYKFNSENGCEGDLHYALGYFNDYNAAAKPTDNAASNSVDVIASANSKDISEDASSTEDVATSPNEVEISLSPMYITANVEERTWHYVRKQHEHAKKFLDSLSEHNEFKCFVKWPGVIEADIPHHRIGGGVTIMRWGAPIHGVDKDKIANQTSCYLIINLCN